LWVRSPPKNLKKTFCLNRNPRKKWRFFFPERCTCLWRPLFSCPPSGNISSVAWLWSFVVKHVSSSPGGDPKISKIVFSCESDPDKNGQSKMRGSHARCSYSGVMSAVLAQVALGPLGRLWPLGSIPGGWGLACSPVCFWTRAAAPGIHLAPSKPPIRVKMGQRNSTPAWCHAP
jgi:hypothetical protein